MRLILTHEQADLDAIASQLGAWLLDTNALPVLPQRLNRNVRAFLTIYNPHLPFVERRDLPRKSVESITLVDTQSVTTLKGMSAQTRVHVVDHHEPRTLPDDWNITIQPTGANTTLLVETIQDQNRPLSPIQATLLLLGIYEDTGSLTYTRTTPRDLYAAAYLLEQGASLDIAKDYLNHPLSLSQQALYEHLRDEAETHFIHGHTIFVATGDAREMDEELSTIAHKLRDLLEPDGLILLIAIQGGVQLIARSTDDHVNVARIAAHFGGGGHPRAAAAMIKRGDLATLHSELLDILPEHVRPAITISQIMSAVPQLLTPNTPLEEAAERMARYGYEGYPVVENGRIIGLLTRRAVDRALSHRLKLPIRNLMEAGEVTVRPDDPLELLQRVMTDTGWGQIPVMDPDTGQITGIVTRTDLLKTLAPEPAIPGYRNLSELLEKSIPTAHLALLQTIAETAHEQRQALYIVGGFVRDLLLEHPSLDFDLVVEGEAIALAKALARKHGGRVTTHARFGTAKWILGEPLSVTSNQYSDVKEQNTDHLLLDTVDLITARTEFYTHPTALPTVERGSIKLDLHRRDFTINTLALRLDGLHYGELHDYWGGYNDLRQGVIRVLHSISFVDDPTRMLRAVRFEQRFGFQIEDRTLELIQAALVSQDSADQPLLDRVSGDRIRHELDHILAELKATEMFTRLNELGLLRAIHPDLFWDDRIRAWFAALPETVPGPEWGLGLDVKGVPIVRAVAYTLWLGQLPPAGVGRVARRLKLPQALETIIESTRQLKEEDPNLWDAAPSVITGRLDQVHPLALYVHYLTCEEATVCARLTQYVTQWQHVHPQMDGNALRARGLAPGPVYAEILSKLRAAWLDGEISSVDEEDKLVAEFLNQP
ncbi:MAG TPA: CBS domain-containing protein [Anaerolineales bacterium]|nr:CBS domain-containing protein [Anaerolineales bacterium]